MVSSGVITGRQVSGPVRERVDACVIGSGAGGAVVAKELAEAGLSVVVMEEGGYYPVEARSTKYFDMFRALYRNCGVVSTLGMPLILIGVGSCVGGSTVVNGGTCWRIPDSVLRAWENDHGIPDLSPRAMAPYFERIEQLLHVGPVREELLGNNSLLFKRGAEALGLNAGPVMRNARDCQASGHCAIGCPHGAKQSMEVSYLPLAFDHGARLYANCRAEQLVVKRNTVRAVGGSIRNPDTGERYRVEVEADKVVLAAGALHTPVLLQGNRLVDRYGQVGRHFMIHPLAKAIGIFDEPVDGYDDVVQSYGVYDLMDQGMLIMTAFAPPEVVALSVPFVGDDHYEVMKQFRHMAIAGVLVSDSTRGEVLRGPKGHPLPFYMLDEEARCRLVRGIRLTAEIFFAAGAKRVILPFHSSPVVSDSRQLRQLDGRRMRNGDLEVVSLHPMGTCRMGPSPRSAPVDAHGELHEVQNLFVADASLLPGPLGVNPQIGIMALAARTAAAIVRG